MWQSQTETKYYSVTCFNCILEFNALYRCASAKGGAHTCFKDSSDIYAFKKCVLTLPLAEAEQQHAKLGDALEIHDKIIFDFYWGMATCMTGTPMCTL